MIGLHGLNFTSSHSFVGNFQDIVAFAVQVLSRSYYSFLLPFLILTLFNLKNLIR